MAPAPLMVLPPSSLAPVAGALLAAVMLLVVWQPRGLPVVVPAVLGALGSLALGLVGGHDLVRVIGLTWNATLALVGLMLLSATLDGNGAFRAAAHRIARAAGGDGRRLFVGLSLLTAAAATVLANDGAILILTPIVAELATALAMTEAQALAYLFTVGFLCDGLSTLLPTSNLTNILLVDALGVNALAFAGHMLLPTLALLVTATAVLGWSFGRRLPRHYPLAALGPAPPFARRSSWATWLALGLLVAGYAVAAAVRLPLGIVVLVVGGGVLAFESLGGRVDARALLGRQPWSILFFAFSLFVVVYGVGNAGAAQLLATLLDPAGRGPLLALVVAGVAVSLLCAAVNNLPVLLLTLLALRLLAGAHGPSASPSPSALPYAALLGANVGSKLTPIGSLATLLWLHLLSARGIRVGWGRYLRMAALPTAAALVAALLALGVTQWLLG
jgi:arsenical pump membrane protein